ncbi:hypothetical protein [Streptomyces sp. NPDC047046]|uniref:hypothetical protein n=1 Tax=Streptomyces sp. NPDC047046 TaxID=3155378 RepID=UPI0033EDBA2B
MSGYGRLAVATLAGSAVAAATGVVSGVLTESPSLAWALALLVLVVVGAAVQFWLLRWDAGGGGGEGAAGGSGRQVLRGVRGGSVRQVMRGAGDQRMRGVVATGDVEQRQGGESRQGGEPGAGEGGGGREGEGREGDGGARA